MMTVSIWDEFEKELCVSLTDPDVLIVNRTFRMLMVTKALHKAIDVGGGCLLYLSKECGDRLGLSKPLLSIHEGSVGELILVPTTESDKAMDDFKLSIGVSFNGEPVTLEIFHDDIDFNQSLVGDRITTEGYKTAVTVPLEWIAGARMTKLHAVLNNPKPYRRAYPSNSSLDDIGTNVIVGDFGKRKR